MKKLILQRLKEADTFISGETLCKELGVTRSAIWKNIKSLKGQGYEIESVQNKGYRLRSTPDILNTQEILDGLTTEFMGKTIYSFDTLDSTNDVAKEYANNNCPDGTIIIAEQQKNGKGRLGRSWTSSPYQNITFSIVLRPNLAPHQLSIITLIIGLAVCKAIRSISKCDAMIKWPNDIIIGNKKICGILTEISAEAEQINYIVCGIGINVNCSFSFEDIAYKSTSLFMETQRVYKRKRIVQVLLAEIEKVYLDYMNSPTAVLEEYKKYCVSLGKVVSAQQRKEPISGVAIDISDGGELIIESETKQLFTIFSGEVSVQNIY